MKFTVRSAFGTFEPRSPARLKNCLNEIDALDRLEKISESDLFVKGLKKSASDFEQEVEDLITGPVKTVEGLSAGVDRFFKRTYRAAKIGTQRLGDAATGDRDEKQLSGAGAKLPGGTASHAGNSTNVNV